MSTKPETVDIYSLSDPRTKAVRYVGQGFNAARRLKGHLSSASKADRKGQWLLSLQRLGLSPSLTILETCDAAKWGEREAFWIEEMKRRGRDLLNANKGCPGGGHVRLDKIDALAFRLHVLDIMFFGGQVVSRGRLFFHDGSSAAPTDEVNGMPRFSGNALAKWSGNRVTGGPMSIFDCLGHGIRGRGEATEVLFKAMVDVLSKGRLAFSMFGGKPVDIEALREAADAALIDTLVECLAVAKQAAAS